MNSNLDYEFVSTYLLMSWKEESLILHPGLPVPGRTHFVPSFLLITSYKKYLLWFLAFCRCGNDHDADRHGETRS